MKILILIIFIILIFILNSNFKKKEYYDEKINKKTINKCANFCKQIDCMGFGYDEKKNICYPSKTILNKYIFNENKLYGKNFNNKHIICNKMFDVNEFENDNSGFVNKKNNSLYVCHENNNKPKFYIQNKNQFKSFKNLQYLDYIKDIDKYTINKYKWPKK